MSAPALLIECRISNVMSFSFTYPNCDAAFTKAYSPETRRKYNVPVSAYSVSGEYALVKAASQLGYVNEKDITLEILHSIKRAGADMIVTYFAKSASRFLQES